MTLQAPWHKGVCFYLLPSFGGAFYTKSPRRPRQAQASFPIALKLFTNIFLIGSINRVQRHLPTQKPNQKHKNLNSEGRRFRSPFFLCQTQNFKAVAMDVVAAYCWCFMPKNISTRRKWEQLFSPNDIISTSGSVKPPYPSCPY
jgi:hypothetical protein